MKNLSHFDEKSQSFWPSQVGRYALVTGSLATFNECVTKTFQIPKLRFR